MKRMILSVGLVMVCALANAEVEHYDLQLEHSYLEPDGRIQVGFERHDG